MIKILEEVYYRKFLTISKCLDCMIMLYTRNLCI